MPTPPLRTRLRDRVLGPPGPPPTDGDPVLADVVRAAIFFARPVSPQELADAVGRPEVQVLLALQRGLDRGLRVEERADGFVVHAVSTRPVMKALADHWSSGAPDEPSPDSVRRPPVPERLQARVMSARQAFQRGEPRAALAQLGAALASLQDATNPGARLLRAGLLVDAATYLRATTDPQALLRARELAQQAIELAEDGDPVALQASARVVLGSLCADIGSESALDEAIDAFTEAARMLTEANRPVEATCLLNDLAEVWMRRGDVVRATHLLRRSREAFLQHPENPVAARELADTEHLLARLPFHAQARGGEEAEMWLAARDHALAAVQRYGELGATPELGRAQESLGRILVELGRHEEALRVLADTDALQVRIRDRLGLARTAHARASALAALGEHDRAFDELERSVELDLSVGAVAGLKHNGATLLALAPHAPERAERLAQQLQTALDLLGPE